MAGRSVGSISVTVDADTGRLQASIVSGATKGARKGKTAAERELSGIEADVGINLNTTELRAAVARIEASVDAIAAHLGVEVDQASIEKANAAMEAGIDEKIVVNVRTDVDDAAKAAADAKLRSNFAEVGRKSGEDFGGEFGGALVAGVALLAQPAAVALEGVLSAATATISSAFSALTGGAGALTPILAGLGGSLTAVVVGSQGLFDALGAINDEFKAATVEGRKFDITADKITDAFAMLGPEAKDFATAFAEILPAFHDLQTQVSGRLFRGLGDVFRDLADTAIPSITEALEGAADSTNEFFRQLADVLAGIDFGALFEALQPALDATFDAITAVFSALEPFLLAAAPAAQQLAEGLARGAEALADMVERGLESGALTDFLTGGVESLGLWWDLLRNIGDALFTVFQAGKQTGDDFIATLADIVGRWDAWLESTEGQDELKRFFADGRKVMEDLVPVLKGLQGFFDNLITPEALASFGELTASLGEFLPAFGELLNQAGRMDVLVSLFDTLTTVFDSLSDFLDVMPDWLLELAGGLLAVGGALKGISFIAGPLVGGLKALAGATALYAGALETFATASTLSAVAAKEWAAVILGPAGVVVASALLADVVGRQIDPGAHSLFSTEYWTEDLPNAINEGILKGKIATKDFWGAGTTGEADPDLQHIAEQMGLVVDATDEAKLAAAQLQGQWDKIGAQPVVDIGLGTFDAAKDSMNAASVEVQRMQGVLAGFPATAELAAEAQDYFNAIAAEVDAEPIEETSDAMSRARDAATDAASAADLLHDAWDTLFGGAMELSEATDAFAATLLAIGDRQKEQAERVKDQQQAQEDYAAALDDVAQAEDDLRQAQTPEEEERAREALERTNDTLRDRKTALQDANKALSENLFAIRGNTEAALENRDTIRSGIDEAIDIAAAKVREGASWEQARKSVLANKDALLDQLEQQGFNREAAERYIETLNLTPKNIRTAIELANREAVSQGLDDISFKIKQMDGKGVTTPVAVSGLEAVMAGLDGIKGTADDIDRKTAKLAVSTEGVPTTNAELQSTIDKANELDGKHSTVTVDTNFNFNQQGSAAAFFQGLGDRQHGGQVGSRWGLAGEAGAEFLRVGSLRGLVSRPTLVPPGTVVTSAALTGAILRGLPSGGPTIGRQVNASITVIPNQADPEAVATSVVNRMAVLAR